MLPLHILIKIYAQGRLLWLLRHYRYRCFFLKIFEGNQTTNEIWDWENKWGQFFNWKRLVELADSLPTSPFIFLENRGNVWIAYWGSLFLRTIYCLIRTPLVEKKFGIVVPPLFHAKKSKILKISQMVNFCQKRFSKYILAT